MSPAQAPPFLPTPETCEWQLHLSHLEGIIGSVRACRAGLSGVSEPPGRSHWTEAAWVYCHLTAGFDSVHRQSERPIARDRKD